MQPLNGVNPALIRRPRPGERFGSMLMCWMAGLLLLLATAFSARAQTTTDEHDDFEIWKAVLESTGSDASLMQASALRLINSGWPMANDLIGSYLGQYDRPIRIAAISAALRESSTPPEVLGPILIQRLAEAPADLVPVFADAISAYPSMIVPALVTQVKDANAPVKRRVAFISALSRFTEVEVVDELIACLEPDEPEEIRTAAVDALRSVTGVDFGTVMSRWQSWWRSQRLQGREGLIVRKMEALEKDRDAARRRNLDLQQEVNALQGELLASLGRVYALTEPDQRFALLSTWLGSPRPAIRRMSLDLVEQRVLNAEPVPQSLTQTVTALIGDDDLSVRREAVQCLALLNQSLAAKTVAPLLTDGLDPTLDEAILTVLSKSAEPSAVPELLRRFRQTDRARLVTQAVLTACQAGFVTPVNRDLIAHTILEQTDVAVRDRLPLEIELLAWSAGDESRQALETLLEDAQASPDRKLAAARGIFQSGQHTELLARYAGDPVVQPWSLQWAAATPSLEQLKMISTWTPHDNDAYLAAITKIMTALLPTDWLAADDILASIKAVGIESRIGWLARVLTLKPATSDNGESTESAFPSAIRVGLLVRLAELHYAQGHPEALLAVVQAANGSAPGPGLERFKSIARVANGQIGIGDEAPAPATLMDALDLVLRSAEPKLEIAQNIVDRLNALSAQVLDQAAQMRLADLTHRLDVLLAQRSNVDAQGSDGG